MASSSPPPSSVAFCKASDGLLVLAISQCVLLADSAVQKKGILESAFPWVLLSLLLVDHQTNIE